MTGGGTGTGGGRMTGGGFGAVGGGGGRTAATGAGAPGAAGGDGARGADGGGPGLDRRMARVGAGDAPRRGTVRNISRRRAAAPVAICARVAWIVAGATTGGCTSARAGLAAGDGVVERAVGPTGASGFCCRALLIPNARTVSSTIVMATAPLRV